VTDLVVQDPRGRAAVYAGETAMDGNVEVMQGQGCLTVTEDGPNKGNTIRGQFQANKPHGQAAWTGASGSKYEGSWKEGSFHGLGVFTWDDGSRYEGSFVNDQFHGKGAKYNPDGSLDFDGMWWNDDFLSDLGTPASTVTGKETVDPRGRAALYTGDVVDGLPDGNGEIIVTEVGPNKGASYKGHFKAGKMHGDGIWTSATSGASYEGSWVDGCFHGKGTYKWDDGSNYAGEFMDDKFHGRGIKTTHDGKVEHDGLWWCDEPVE